VGESGSGKTTLGRAVLGLVPASGGSIRFAGEDITKVSRARRRQLSSEIQAVFQDPYSSLDPRMAVGDILTEPMLGHQGMTARTAKTRVRDLLDRVKLPADAYSKHPSEFSGGQRQRIAIARALAMSPRLIVCDEALSALDLSTQRTVVELLEEIQQDTGVAYLFIAHDLSVVRNISDRVAVMYHGEIVETGDAEVIGDRPTHPYTKRLLLAAPVPDPARQEQRRIARTAQQTKILERNAQ
jgi:ABC-type oligopeptide transport system ATPase subunit